MVALARKAQPPDDENAAFAQGVPESWVLSPWMER